MKINRLELKNFSSYEGICSFDFKVDNHNKNIILIGGKNGAGKSSLFLSIKLALYGPLCFAYQGTNAMYFSRIKEIINHNAFKQDEVEAHVELDFDLFEEREHIQYIIKRTWRYTNQKIGEHCEVYKGGLLLSSDDMSYFHNYLQSVLPINLFDFYFFDGEQIADFFATSSYSSYLKNALLTMCSIDTFEYIRKYAVNYVQKNNEDISLESAKKEYDDCLDRIAENAKLISEIETEIARTSDILENLLTKKDDVERAFLNAGGITEEQKYKLSSELKTYENIKLDCSAKIKNFTDSLLPFIIVSDYVPEIKEQLYAEDELKKYNTLKSRLNANVTTQIINESISEHDAHIQQNDAVQFANLLLGKLIDKFKPADKYINSPIIHDLSDEQKSKLLGLIDKIENFTPQDILDTITLKQNATDRTININRKLRTSIDEYDVKEYTQKINEISQEIIQLNQKIVRLQDRLLSVNKEHDDNNSRLITLVELFRSKAQDKNIYELTQRISKVTEHLVADLSRDKFKQLETHFVDIIKMLMRKENIIDHVVIDEKFNLLLYQRQTYALSDLLKLMNNVGYEELQKRIGQKGIEKVYCSYGVKSLPEFKKYINMNMEDYIDLYKKVEFNQFSKGEKQIFILALYWAIIKISDRDIPFIIDTPYARIDTEHREQISKIFFPGISSQVVIFSTDEEINEYYYNVIKPNIGQEYLLINDEESNMTSIKKGYFFKGRE